jgi:hypothetical protein
MHEHEQAIAWITQKEFATEPGLITRMGNGICNEVYLVEVGERELIFRLKDEPRGLIDLDSLARGDPLEAIGRIKASWYGTHYGQVYADAIMDSLQLSDEHRRIVTMYAVLNRTFWTFENGIQFNQNTSPIVDREREIEDKHAVRAMYAELRGSTAMPEFSTKASPGVEDKPGETSAHSPRATRPANGSQPIF